MARRPLHEREIRKLLKFARTSIAVTLPIELARELKWRAGQKVTVKKQGSKLIIEDWKSS